MGLPPEQLANWLTLYAATGICAMLAACGAAVSVVLDLRQSREWKELNSLKGITLFVPRFWWRWQKRYLTATPVILLIVVYYGFTLDW